MKYWKQFWGSLNQGWKRIHYLVFGVPSVCWLLYCIFAVISIDNGPILLRVIAVLLGGILVPLIAVLIYGLLVIAVFWVKEGFEPKAPTEEE